MLLYNYLDLYQYFNILCYWIKKNLLLIFNLNYIGKSLKMCSCFIEVSCLPSYLYILHCNLFHFIVLEFALKAFPHYQQFVLVKCYHCCCLLFYVKSQDIFIFCLIVVYQVKLILSWEWVQVPSDEDVPLQLL